MQKISFIINTSVNTLDHLKLLMKSLNQNLNCKEHEIIVFVDSDNEGTTNYLIDQKKNFFDLNIIIHKLKPCIGYSRNSNLLVEFAKHDVVAYLQSDMVISKDYDLDILKDLEDNCILSATRIEPPLHGESHLTITKDFGLDPNEFKWEEFLKFSESQKYNKQLTHFFAPFVFHKKVWLEIGGYDTLFRRSREDSDLLQRFIHKGIKIKQTFNANVYHFSCVTSRGKKWFEENNTNAKKRVELQKIADKIELKKFIRKWGGFNHGEYKLNKLDLDLVVKNYSPENLDIILELEPFFSRVWLKTDDDRNAILKKVEREQDPANKLLDFSEEDWSFASKFFNLVDYQSIYCVGEPDHFNIKVQIDIKNTDFQKDILIQNLTNLFQIIESNEPGNYELGSSKIEVKRIVITSNEHICVNNPKFDYNLLQTL